MPYRVTSDGYDVPGPVGADYFNEQQDAIKQRRLELARMLEAPKTDNGWGGVGAALVRNLSSGYWQGQLDKEERDLSSKRAEAAQKWLDKMPQDTPAQPEVNPSMPPSALEQLGGGPPMPQTYKPPVETEGGMVPQPMTYEHKDATPFLPASLKDTAKWAMEGAGFSPLHGAIALDAYKQANDRKKGVLPKWKVEEIFDKDTGLKRKVLIDENDPSKPPIPVGGTELKEAKDSALTERTKSANEMLRSRFPGKSDDWYKMNAQGLALGDIAIAQDGTIVSKSGAIAGMTGGGAPPTPTTGTSPPAGAPGTKVPPAVQAQRDVGRLGILRQEEADLLAQPDTPQRTQSLAAVRTEIKNMGGAASEAAPADPYAKYRNDPRSKSYLPEPDVPGVIQRGPQTAKADRLNADVQKLGDDYVKQKLPELTTASKQADEEIAKQVAAGSIEVDKKTGKYLNVPGFGGPMGIANKLPALTEDGRNMQLALEPLKNLALAARSGQAVTDQELNRILAEMGQSWNQGDAQFWTGYEKFKKRLAELESSVTSGYAPIVVDTYKAGKTTGGGTSPAAPAAASSGAGKTIRKKVVIDGKTHVLYTDGSEGVL